MRTAASRSVSSASLRAVAQMSSRSLLASRRRRESVSNVFALVKAEGKYYVAAKEIKVTLGGCGG